jgi:hypothetical protein
MEGILAVRRVDAQPYNWPHDAPMDSKTTALVIIDMQKDCEYILFQCFLVFFLSGTQAFLCQYISILEIMLVSANIFGLEKGQGTVFDLMVQHNSNYKATFVPSSNSLSYGREQLKATCSALYCLHLI